MPFILHYVFMQKALLVGIALGIILPCIGVTVVLKRLSMIGDALAHASLAGVAIGLLTGFNPILGAALACVFSALSMEGVRKRFPAYSELSIAIIMSGAIGLAGLLSTYVKSGVNFNSFLFGSIVAITDLELYLVLLVSAFVLIAYIMLYHELFYVALDEVSSRLAGVPVRLVNLSFTVLTALSVALAARTVGTLIVSSVMVIPVACAMQIARSYKQTIFYAIAFSLSFILIGLTLSYYVDLKPGSTIVLLGVLTLIGLTLLRPRRS